MKIIQRYAFITLEMVALMLILSSTRANVQAAAHAGKTTEAPAGNAENGRKLFKRDGCYECHGLEAQGSPVSGPRIGPNPIPFEALLTYVRHPTGEMPPYTDKVVTDKELADIYAFLQSLPHPPAAKTIPLLN